MEIPTYSKALLIALFLSLGFQTYSQNFVPFSPRYDEAIKGDMLLIGNSNIGIHVSDPYNGTNSNDQLNAAVHVDIDVDPSTFNSSSADLSVPNNANCYQIVYAGLYWSSVVNGPTPRSDIKFKVPGGSYIDITGTEIYYQNATNNNNSNSFAYYHDVTNLVSALPSPEGTYTVANISSLVGPRPNSEGLSAGWSLFVIYEDPLLPSKYITSFDGFTKITSTINETIPLSGFETIPTGPVRAKYAFSTIEGDRRWTGDYLLINGTTIDATNNAGTIIRPDNNFFNSTASIIDPITNTPELLTAKNPNSSNTLGFDAGIINIPNAGNTVIANGATNADISLGSNLDIYYFYFNAFAIEIIAPNIVLTKIVEDELGNDIGGQIVDLGDELNYVIGFENTGNDDATNLIIRDVLPTNIVFNYPADIGLLPPGVTVQSYNSTTRELVFRVDESVVEENDPVQEIRFQVTVVATCSLLSDACSNIINNQAFSTYQGTINSAFTISDDPSFSTNTGCLLTPGATNFLADINDCTFEEDVILCGDNTVLTAGNGYDSYSWSSSPTGTPVIGTTQSITVTTPGTYYVHNSAIAPCQDTDQVFNVITFGANVTNPILQHADQVVTCPNDGKELPNIFLCGANDTRFIQTNITDATSIIWEQLDETSCTAVVNPDCANEDSSCTWNQIATGSDFTINGAGQFRLTLNYPGGCFNQFYFNAYQNILSPTATSNDIICSTPGQIIVGGVPSGYEFSIDGTNFQSSNIFSTTTAGNYTVSIRQIGVTPNPCIFTVPDVQVRERQFTSSIDIVQPICNGDLGSIVLAANDVRPQYSFSIYQGTTLINSVGPINDDNYTFNNLNPGTYTVNISSEDGCLHSENIDIVEPPLLEVTSALTTPFTACTDGVISIYPTGGTPPYYYFINSTTVFQSTPTYTITQNGEYTITVTDSNNCTAETTMEVYEIEAPQYTIDKTDILCYNDNNGEIRFNVTNANGYIIEYSIDNGVTYEMNPVFSNLESGTYPSIIRYYTFLSSECFSVAQDIIVAQPDEALTASSGVSELAGCGPSGEGRVRITNPQGGTPFSAPNLYEYSFDNQATWVATNEAYVLPGTYTFYVRDANGCIYAMPDVVLDPEPVAPTIDVGNPDFNCDGTANSTVTVNNTGSNSFSYSYLLNGVVNPNTIDPRTFLNVPNGSHTITVQYQLETVPTYSNLLYETFGYGADTSSPGMNPTYYCFERQVVATQCKNNIRIQDGDYSVTSRIVRPYGAWIQPIDHTPATNPVTPDGRFLVVNIGASIPATEILYEKFIDDIIPNQPINVEFFAMNLLNSGNTQFNPDLRVALIDASGTEISSFTTGEIPKSEIWENYPKTPITLDPGSNTSLRFIVRSNVQQTSGNDVAIDDIRVFQLPTACITEVNFPFVVNPGNAFSAQLLNGNNVSCLGANDGTLTIAAQNFDAANGFQYSIDNGATWITQMTSPYTVTGLASGNYDVQVRYENDPATCSFSFTHQIGSPTVTGVSVNGTPITCLTGSTITASGTGGTLPYSYELLDTATLGLVSNFPTSGILTNVAVGNYTVRMTDANGCEATNTINLSAPVIPTGTINTLSDYCYDSVNGASLEVNASGGVAPYQYSINGGAFVSNNIFSNLIPGSYIITVRDAYGCTFDLPAETIENQMTSSVVLTKALDCSASPDAIITGTIVGGYAPYTYEVSINGASYTSLGTTGTSFSYSSATNGTFQFRVTDSRGCISQSNVQTITAISNPEITLTQTQFILCNGDSNGTIDIAVNNTVGTPAFTINVENTTTSTNYGTQTSGLPAGDYTVTITDSNSCTDIEIITIGEPDAIDFQLTKVDITCNNPGGSSLGEITVENLVGGTAPFTYYITNNFGDAIAGNPYTALTGEDHTFNVINFGTYTVNVVDANGCNLNRQEVIVSPPSDLQIDVNTLVPDCTTGGTAEITAISVLGSGNYEFGVLEFNTVPYTTTYLPADIGFPNRRTFTGLVPGVIYTFVVHDLTTNCYFVRSADAAIDPASTLTSVVTPNNVLCQGENNGSVTFTIDNFDTTTTSVDYEIFRAYSNVSVSSSTNLPVTFGTPETVTTPSPGSLSPGSYYILFTENGTGSFNGCESASVIFDIRESAETLEIDAAIDNNANCNPNEGVISIIGSRGTAPYRYQLTTSITAPLATDPLWNSANVFNRDGGNYYAHVIDTYGCIRTSPVLVLQTDAEPVISASVNNQCTVTEGNFEIDVLLTTSGIVPHSYSVDGGAFQTRVAPFTITNMSSGNHTIEVRDSNGCGNSVNVNIETPIALTPEITSLPNCPNDDGVITVLGSGGTGSYNYSISPNPLSISLTGNVFSGVPSGTYTVTITDATTLCTNNVDVTLSTATPVTFTSSPEPVTCNGGSDGVITVNLPVTNDNPIYTYEITSGPTTFPVQNSNVFTGLSTGTYRVQVNSGRGCEAFEDVFIGEPDAIVITAPTIVEYICSSGVNTSNFASITVNTIAGGSGTYEVYEFIKGGSIVQSGANNTFIEADLTGGNYTINVYDNNGCLGSTTAVIQPYVSIDSIVVNVNNAITCTNNEDIVVSVNSTGGIPTNLEYTVEDINSAGIQGTVYSQTNSSGIFNGLPIGNYVVAVLNLDTDCILQTNYYVNDPNTFDLLIDSVVDVTCFNDNNGGINVTFIDRVTTPTDDSGPFDYTVIDNLGATVRTGVVPNAGPELISGLSAGTYTITTTLTNSPFCNISKNFTITAPTSNLTISETHTEITCVSGNNDGTISASANGGWPGAYEFQLELLSGTIITPYNSVSNFTNLVAEDYVIRARDSRGCIVSTNVSLVNPTPITATETPSTLLCFGDDNGTITISNVSGGQGSNYIYTLNMVSPNVSSSGPQSSNVFNNLVGGTYTVTITDGYNCSYTSSSIVIIEPTQVQVSLRKSIPETCINDASLTLGASGGSGSYEYSDDPSFTGAIPFTTPITFGVTDGTYQYYVRDTNGCLGGVSNEIVVEPIPTLTLSLDETNASIKCESDANGIITATAEGGQGGYTYTLIDNLGNDLPTASQPIPGVFTNLPAGNYQVRVESGNCLPVIENSAVIAPNVAMEVSFNPVNVTCNGANDGILEIDITPGTGTGIIKYAISPRLDQFFDINDIEDLSPGRYQVVVQDELGCFELHDFDITEPDLLGVISHTIITEAPCNDDTNGSFSVEIAGGIPPYSISLDDVTYVTLGAGITSHAFTGLSGGEKMVYILDSTNCGGDSPFAIPFPESVTLNPIVDIDYGCTNDIANNTNTVTNIVTVVVDDSITDTSGLQFSLDGSPFTLGNGVFENLAVGPHVIDVMHPNGCVQSTDLGVSFIIDAFTPLTLALDDGGLNEIVAKADGGNGPYTYTLNGEDQGSKSNFLIYASGDYTVTATDSNGCIATATRYFEFIDVCITNYFTPNGDGNMDRWGPGCTTNYSDLTYEVFDRYGRRVAKLNYGQKWDGKYNGVELPSGDYWYVVKLNDKNYDREFVGNFTLYR